MPTASAWRAIRSPSSRYSCGGRRGRPDDDHGLQPCGGAAGTDDGRDQDAHADRSDDREHQQGGDGADGEHPMTRHQAGSRRGQRHGRVVDPVPPPRIDARWAPCCAIAQYVASLLPEHRDWARGDGGSGRAGRNEITKGWRCGERLLRPAHAGGGGHAGARQVGDRRRTSRACGGHRSGIHGGCRDSCSGRRSSIRASLTRHGLCRFPGRIGHPMPAVTDRAARVAAGRCSSVTVARPGRRRGASAMRRGDRVRARRDPLAGASGVRSGAP